MLGTAGLSQDEISAKGLRLALVVSRYNKEICDGLMQGAIKELERLGLPSGELMVHRVPGAFELPLLAKLLAETGNIDGIICLGVVVRGETAHFDFVCQGATQGLQSAMLQTGVPMGFGVLTTDTQAQAQARAQDDEHNKGLEAAQTVVEMVILKKRIQT